MVSRARVVGLDYGKKRVGLAIADPLRLFAQPFGTFPPQEALTTLQKMQVDEGIETLVVGWPLTEEGEEGEATRFVQGFIHRLRRLLPRAEIVRWDERYTSEMAREQLHQLGGTRKKRRERGRVDKMAAAIILQEYLDSSREPGAALSR